MRYGWILGSGVILGVSIFTGFALASHFNSEVRAKEVQPELTPPRTAYVNIASLLKNYKKANAEGIAISTRRQEYISQIEGLRKEMQELNAKTTAPGVSAAEKDDLHQKAVGIRREIENIEQTASRELGKRSDETILEVYKEITSVIDEIVKERSLDIVQIFPGKAPQDELTPVVVQLVLQSPASYPIYLRKDLDMTTDVIDRLNKKFPPDKPGEK